MFETINGRTPLIVLLSLDGKIIACDTNNVTIVGVVPLPAGAATEATLATRALEAGGNLAGINTKMTDFTQRSMIRGIIDGTQLATNTRAFANSDPAGTMRSITLTKPAGAINGEIELEIINPSTVTALSMIIYDTNGAGNYVRLHAGTFGVLASTTITVDPPATITITRHKFVLRGAFTLGNLYIVLSNDTVLGVADGFTVTATAYNRV